MPLYDYQCSTCGSVILDQFFHMKDTPSTVPCGFPLCDGLARKVLHFPALHKSLPAHYNPSLGTYIRNKSDYHSALSRISDEQSARLRHPVNLRPIDLRDKEDCGVTDEGLEPTRRREVDSGQREAKKYL